MNGGSETQDVLVGLGTKVNVAVGVPGGNVGVGVEVGVQDAVGSAVNDGVNVIVWVGVRVGGQPAIALLTPLMSAATTSTG
jgi:hypothetical protein